MLATGYNVVDTAAAKARNIPVTNIPAYGTQAVAQFAIAMLLENPIFGLIGFRFDLFVMFLAAVFSIWSCADYIIKNKGAIQLT